MKIYLIFKSVNYPGKMIHIKTTSDFIIKELIIKRLRKEGYYVQVSCFNKKFSFQYSTIYYPIIK